MSNFTCHRCAANPELASGQTTPMSNMPFDTDYWRKIQAVTCDSCWAAWKDMEVKIINEYRLNLLEREHRKVLKKHMHDFLDVDGKGQSAATPDAIASEWTPEA
jgi:Fe-S cluster biosynthesis and repair protein YggX